MNLFYMDYAFPVANFKMHREKTVGLESLLKNKMVENQASIF